MKIAFKKMSLENNIDIVSWCYKDDGASILDIHNCATALFPKLQEITSDMSEKEIDSFIEKVVTEKYSENESILEKTADRYQIIWDKYNDSFIKELEKYLNIKWPNKDVEATVGIIPVCPRDLDSFNFSVHENMTEDQLIETCAHELCHFLWFEKWKEIHPNYDKKDFESPNKIWEYSEMVEDPVLNSKGISNVLKRNTRYAYDYFYEDENLMKGLFEIYNEDTSIEEKIKKGFEYVENYNINKKDNR